jgi:hypothetical protein
MPFPNEHPRLYFNRDELIDLRKAAQHGVRAEVLRRLVHNCERLIDPHDEYYFDYRERRKPMWKERAGIFALQPSLLLLAFGYAWSGDERYGLAARDAVVEIIRQRVADTPSVAYGASTSGWRRGLGHDKFNYAWSLSVVYDLCHDLFDDKQRALFIEHALESIALIESDASIQREDRAQMANNRGARGVLAVTGIYPLVLEGEVELPKMDEYMAWTASALETYLHVTFDQDGVCFDGPAYAHVLQHIYFLGRALARSGRIDLLRSHRWEQYLHHLVYELLPGGYSLNDLNDCHSPCGTVTPALFLMGREAAAVLPWLARQLELHPRRIAEDSSNLFASFFGSASPIFLLEWRDEIPQRTPAELGYPLSRLFPQRGIASMRSGWDKDDFLVSHRCGYEMWRLHKQSDQNHIALYARGERFLVDEGYGQPELSQMADSVSKVDRYFGRSDVHNTVLIDGRGQNGNQIDTGWAEGRLIDWQHTPQFDTSLGDASEAYGDDHAIDQALRRVVFVRQASHPFVVVIDTVRVDESGEEHDFEVLWRTARGNSIEVGGRSFVIKGQYNDCYGEVVFPDDAELDLRIHFNLPQLRVRKRTACLEMVTVLVPLERDAAPPEISCERIAEGEFRLTVLGGSTRYVLQAGTRTTGPLRLPVPVSYEVGDLDP